MERKKDRQSPPVKVPTHRNNHESSHLANMKQWYRCATASKWRREKDRQSPHVKVLTYHSINSFCCFHPLLSVVSFLLLLLPMDERRTPHYLVYHHHCKQGLFPIQIHSSNVAGPWVPTCGYVLSWWNWLLGLGPQRFACRGVGEFPEGSSPFPFWTSSFWPRQSRAEPSSS